ncbi:MAG: AraC family transcriptional regulator [Achromobacter sp.]|uniref:AraC family transcriptional regulator n=1 Tax=Achromobacter sp. TaxID=134375 RepID=UPI0012CDB9B7|nr:AraC family transcriptional regulator [Achromobacter sp.]
MELHRFESFEEFQDAVVNADLAVRLLGPHDGKWRIGHLDVDGITVQQGIEAVPNLCEASGCPSHLMFLISEGRQSPTWLNGVPFAHDTLGVLAPSRGFVFRAAGPNAWISIAVPISFPMFLADDEAGRILRHWCRATRMLSAPPAAIQNLRNAALLATRPGTSPVAGRALIEAALLALIKSRACPPRPAAGRPRISPHELCDSALQRFRDLDVMAQRSDQWKNMPIGSRSLNSFFQHCFGLGPVQYLHLRRLHHIRAALRDMREPSATIADVFEWGGYPYSAYALSRYRAIFGEPPSETRARSPVMQGT